MKKTMGGAVGALNALHEGQAGLQEQIFGLKAKMDTIDSKVDLRHEENRDDIKELKEDINGNGQPGLKTDVATIKADVASIKDTIEVVGKTKESMDKFKGALVFVGWALGACAIPLLAAAVTSIVDKVRH